MNKLLPWLLENILDKPPGDIEHSHHKPTHFQNHRIKNWSSLDLNMHRMNIQKPCIYYYFCLILLHILTAFKILLHNSTTQWAVLWMAPSTVLTLFTRSETCLLISGRLLKIRVLQQKLFVCVLTLQLDVMKYELGRSICRTLLLPLRIMFNYMGIYLYMCTNWFLRAK